jgi:acetyl/propionyl-CoA carboxylase alpha subunit
MYANDPLVTEVMLWICALPDLVALGPSETVLSEARYVTVPDVANACVTSVEDGLVKAEHIGWPIMIKASEGGGGEG